MTARAVPAADIPDLVARMRAGERKATSLLVTELERASPAMSAIIRALVPHLGRALVVGFTGPPGAGKSTLVNAYVQNLRRAGRRVGIVAVDPSSPVSGGAILGDRIRMTAALADDGVFMRSLASHGALGGLSPAAVRIVDVLDGAGNDVVVLETVGTGQNEIDVAEVADVRIVLAAPGLGDGIQAMKSGLLEIADILVVNQADRPGAEETHQQLRSALSLRSESRGEVPIFKTVAVSGQGVDQLADEISRQGSLALQRPPVERRRRRVRYLIARAAAERIAAEIRRGSAALDALADAVLEGRATPADAADRLLTPATSGRPEKDTRLP
jgi:LAO/AO transport system kinase